MEITRLGTGRFVDGSKQQFTGEVREKTLFDSKDPSHATGVVVTFESGARTAWHTHPVGQHLVITSGTGWVQQEGGEVEKISTGDVVWIPPNVKHWHGATIDEAMTHIAIQERCHGQLVQWLEHVSEQEYLDGVPLEPENGYRG